MDKKRELNNVTDFEALKLWSTFPDEVKEILLSNAFCSNCLVTSFKPGYNLKMSNSHVLIEGHCVTCGKVIARLCD